LAESLKDDKSIGIGKIDASANNGKSTGGYYGVKGFPTLKLIVGKDDLYTYKGPRDLESLKAYVLGGYSKDVKSKRNPSVIEKAQSYITTYYAHVEKVCMF
jgi:Thioredoxin